MTPTDLIIRDFGLEAPEKELTDEELLDLLSDVVAYMVEHRLDFLLSLMYRMDVLEHKINYALSPMATEPTNVGLARLILERQKQRVFTKQFYKQEVPEDLEEGLEW